MGPAITHLPSSAGVKAHHFAACSCNRGEGASSQREVHPHCKRFCSPPATSRCLSSSTHGVELYERLQQWRCGANADHVAGGGAGTGAAPVRASRPAPAACSSATVQAPGAQHSDFSRPTSGRRDKQQHRGKQAGRGSYGAAAARAVGSAAHRQPAPGKLPGGHPQLGEAAGRVW